MRLRRLKKIKGGCLIVALVLLFSVAGSSQAGVSISDFKVLSWYKSVKLIWRATAPEGSDGMFEIYRSDKIRGSYVLVQQVKLGNKKFIHMNSKTYFFFDKKLKVGRRYYYKLSLRGADQVFGPLGGIASGKFPAT